MNDPGAETDRLRYEFLTAEIQLSLTFTEVARMEFDSGVLEHGQRALADARRGYETVTGFLADPRHSGRLTGPQLNILTESARKLREAIDAINPTA